MSKSFEVIGSWWHNKDIPLIKLNGVVYALSGWTGESYIDSWVCEGEEYMEAKPEVCRITPLYNEQCELIDYSVQING